MISQAPIMGVALLVKNQVNQVKTRKQSRWELDVVDHTQFRVILGVHWVGGSKNGCSRIQGTDYASLSNRNSLLFHGFVKNHSGAIIHLIEFINAANASV